MKRLSYTGSFTAMMIAGIMILSPCQVLAVVTSPEKLDEFTKEDLETFHEALMKEERGQQAEDDVEAQKNIEAKKQALADVEGDKKDAMKKELEELQKELLNLPKRDRVHFGLDGDYTFDSNQARALPGHQKSDSTFNANANVEFDLSGRKTDLRFEVAGGHSWSIFFPEKDYWSMEERLRYRRKYFKKITQSANSRISRNNEKTIEIDDNKIRWDSNQQTSLNWLLTRKLSFNGDFGLTHRVFTQEAFDQDSSWQYTFSPSAFWAVTPKSRLNLGYSFGSNHPRSKSGKTDSHEVHTGYFGQVTRKSSASVDIAYSRQVPKSSDGSTVNTVTAGLGYIYQMTPKTQGTLQYVRSFQNSTSEVVQGTDDTTVKNGSYVIVDNLSFSLNSRLTQKLTASLSAGATHTGTKNFEDDKKTSDSGQFSFPFTIAANYLINRWARLRVSYTFSVAVGDEKEDYYRDHMLSTGLNLRF